MPHHPHRPAQAQRRTMARAKARTEAFETVKDAVGIFAILTMLYVGLFIPTL